MAAGRKINDEFLALADKDIEFYGKNFKRLYSIGEKNGHMGQRSGVLPGVLEF